MKVILIGSNGFLARQIGRYCNEAKYYLIVYGKSIPQTYQYNEYFKIDLLIHSFEIEKLLNADIIIYAAGAGIQFHLQESQKNIYNLNFNIPSTLYKSLQDYTYAGTFVTFGSYFEIGENRENKLFSELDILNNKCSLSNDYSKSKFKLTNFIYKSNPKIKYLHFILPTIYGEQESKLRLIPYTIDSIIKKTKLELTSGDQIRQYIHINNVVKIIFITVYNNINSDIYNIQASETYSVKDLVTKIYKLMNTELPVEVFGRSRRIDEGMKILQIDGSKLYSKLKGYPQNIKIEDVIFKYLIF
jgi:nucleoside-diphosphate-sugar epimerase